MLVDEVTRAHSDLEIITKSFSHEFKSPIVTIAGNLVMLKDGLLVQDEKIAAKAVKRIEEAASTMQALVDDLLSITKLEFKPATFMQINISDILDQLRKDLSAQLRQSGATLEIQPGLPHVHGNFDSIYLLFKNLIENSIKFSRTDKQPYIQIGLSTEGQDHVFYVQDQGSGIDPRYLDRVFGMFEQLDKNTPGCGSGLTQVKKSSLTMAA